MSGITRGQEEFQNKWEEVQEVIRVKLLEEE
jgi:hypothetical protein